jgi:hypothetical protein
MTFNPDSSTLGTGHPTMQSSGTEEDQNNDERKSMKSSKTGFFKRK